MNIRSARQERRSWTRTLAFYRLVLCLVFLVVCVGAGLRVASAQVAASATVRRDSRDSRDEGGEMLRERYAYQNLHALSDNGRMRSNALTHAYTQFKSRFLGTMAKFGVSRLAGVPIGKKFARPAGQSFLWAPADAGLHPDHSGWVDLGPYDIGGRTRAILIDPDNAQNLWLGSAGGGIWQSTNRGASYTPVNDLMANMAISCMAMDPSNHKTIYASTGEGYGYSGLDNRDFLRGGGLFATANGKPWDRLASTVDAVTREVLPRFYSINRIAVSQDGHTLLLATLNGIEHSPNAGKTWDARLVNEPIADVKFEPGSSLNAVAGGQFSGKIHYTIDGGKSWHDAAAPSWMPGALPPGKRVELTYARARPRPNAPAIVYASADVDSGQIWRSDDGGKTFLLRAGLLANRTPAYFLGSEDGNKVYDQGFYANVIWAGDPKNADLVVVGSINLFKSKDGGNTLAPISDWRQASDQFPIGTGYSAHADHHVIVADPGYNGTTNRTVYFGNDGGIYRTTDLSTLGTDTYHHTGWLRINHNYSVTQFYSGAVDPNAHVLIGGAQDNGVLRSDLKDGPNGWTSMVGGDGGYCAAALSGQQFYSEYRNLMLLRGINNGHSGEYIYGVYYVNTDSDAHWKNTAHTLADAKDGKALFIAPFVLDLNPHPHPWILAGGLSLWRTQNADAPNDYSTIASIENSGPNWTPIFAPYTSDPTTPTNPISAIAVAPGNPDIVWLGYLNGDVCRSVNGTQDIPQFDPRNAKPPLQWPRRFCEHITIDPTDPKIVYVTFGGFEKDNIWKTADGGMSWKPIAGTLPSAPVYCLTVHPKYPRWVYVGTETGVFVSSDGGSNWYPTNEGPSNCPVNELFWMGQTLIAATHGRGMFSIAIPYPPPGR
ncbi:MAG: hypothetical protein JWN14_4036 [Chthonomonadales bacterium]|nr:hypothetical protein [Chthonomonadales bacterium]